MKKAELTRTQKIEAILSSDFWDGFGSEVTDHQLAFALRTCPSVLGKAEEVNLIDAWISILRPQRPHHPLFKADVAVLELLLKKLGPSAWLQPAPDTLRIWQLLDIWDGNTSRPSLDAVVLRLAKAVHIKSVSDTDYLAKFSRADFLASQNEEWYWQRLKDSRSHTIAKHRMVSYKHWEALRNAQGANPIMVTFSLFPDLIAMKTWPKKTSSLLGEVDAKERDIWHYLLTSTSRSFRRGDAAQNGSLRTAVKVMSRNHPPRAGDKAGSWVQSLLSQPASVLPDLFMGGSVLLTYDLGWDTFPQELLKAGTPQQQRKWLHRLLLPPPAGLKEQDKEAMLQYKLGVLYRTFRLMSQEVYDEIIPELKCLGCVTAILWPLTSKVASGSVNRSSLVPLSELQALAGAGLHFAGALKTAKGEAPWLDKDSPSEWRFLHDLVLMKSDGQEAWRIIEAAWRDAVLAEVVQPSKIIDEGSYDVPQL